VQHARVVAHNTPPVERLPAVLKVNPFPDGLGWLQRFLPCRLSCPGPDTVTGSKAHQALVTLLTVRSWYFDSGWAWLQPCVHTLTSCCCITV